MGVKSTIDIKRESAIKFILDNLYKINDVALAEVVEAMNDHLYKNGDYSLGLHNFWIV